MKRNQTAKKRINRLGNRSLLKNTVRQGKVYVQNISANRILNEFRQYQRRNIRKRNQSIRKSQQCISNTIQRRQCKKRTAHTSKCWIHLAKEDNLRIKPSNIVNAGKGLFAYKKSFPAFKKLSKYTGRKLTEREINRKYGPGLAEYALCDKGICIDSTYTTDAAARFANDPRGSRYVSNSDLTGSRGRFNLKSNKII